MALNFVNFVLFGETDMFLLGKLFDGLIEC
jgi:hypothetical protein